MLGRTLGSSRDITLFAWTLTCVIQYREGRSFTSSFMERPKVDKTDLWLSMIISSDSVVAV